MKPSNQLIVALVFLILAAAGIALVNKEVIKPLTTPTPTERAKLLAGVLPTEITRVSITDNATKTTFSAELDKSSQWKITKADKSKDLGLGVDQNQLVNAVAVLPNMTPTTSFDVVELVPFGLDKPAYTLILTIRGSDTTLQIGAENPDKTDYYVQESNDKQLYLIGNYNLQPFITFLTDPPYVKPTQDPNATPSLTPESTPTPQSTATPHSTGTPGPTGTAASAVTPTATPY